MLRVTSPRMIGFIMHRSCSALRSWAASPGTGGATAGLLAQITGTTRKTRPSGSRIGSFKDSSGKTSCDRAPSTSMPSPPTNSHSPSGSSSASSAPPAASPWASPPSTSVGPSTRMEGSPPSAFSGGCGSVGNLAGACGASRPGTAAWCRAARKRQVNAKSVEPSAAPLHAPSAAATAAWISSAEEKRQLVFTRNWPRARAERLKVPKSSDSRRSAGMCKPPVLSLRNCMRHNSKAPPPATSAATEDWTQGKAHRAVGDNASPKRPSNNSSGHASRRPSSESEVAVRGRTHRPVSTGAIGSGVLLRRLPASVCWMRL
mmetsp:Transcript_64668/g.192700  ORF Transcript_64668/g.192700 Transcript_64668/m.192700 type:complete len:317 (+) Transcript_64668:388-1338(+)